MERERRENGEKIQWLLIYGHFPDMSKTPAVIMAERERAREREREMEDETDLLNEGSRRAELGKNGLHCYADCTEESYTTAQEHYTLTHNPSYDTGALHTDTQPLIRHRSITH